MSAADSLPPTTELYNKSQLVQRHPGLLNDHRVAWALRNRKANGLSTVGAVFDSPCGELLIHEPKFIFWLLGLAGRGKPRALRKRASAAA